MEVSMDTVDEDRISNLPSCIIDLILSFLPMEDVLRTSILSTKWRYKWTTVPNLEFVEKNLHPSMGNGESSRALANCINHVLLLHTGSIEVLHIVDLQGISDIDHWVIFLSRKAIKEFKLEVQDTFYLMHSSLYNCQSLVTLQLVCCSLRPPLNFTGWKSLKSLYLEKVILFDGGQYENDDALENMISSCPLLEDLTLHKVREIGNLHINAQNLLYLSIAGSFRNITFGCTLPKLVHLSVDQYLEFEAHGSAYKKNSLTEFFINLPHIHRLTLRGGFMGYLTAVGMIPERLPFLLNDLHHLTIYLHTEDQRQNLAALCLFQSSPNLTDLLIMTQATRGPGDGMSSIWKCGGERRCCIFEKLRFVRIDDISQGPAVLALVQFLLAESPVLEKMRITHFSLRETVPWKSVLKFKRASAKAEIVLDSKQVFSY